MTKQEFITFWEAKLPPVIARKEIAWFLGGIVSRQALANADTAGTGPKKCWRIGPKSVAYETRSLLEWLVGGGYADVGEQTELVRHLRKVGRARSVSSRLLAADLPRRDMRGGQDANI
ncbi:MAG: hypothetical protein KUA37_02095 [Desulfomicrobium sp.]|nr:hypothetical protein [Pseudomonadota bacterium]MBV1710783.1 hypothetical protein [Desulfomicrobium sp.]MBU4570391.1 hypothetical protein [Pseudomonadota bacterium]MBU4593312.1 hypothetical protein [Pseudomonadota bacterium]MBV1721574.1 hypothetical protein [Desulfomicrobium sp.]